MYVIDKEKVRKQMKKVGIQTQKQLAEKMNLSKNQISILLSTKYNPVKANAIKLCEALDVTLEEIIVCEKYEQYEQLELGLAFDDEEDHHQINEEFIDVKNVIPFHKYYTVELFAGAGGLCLGLEQAGFETVGLVEIDKYACQTLRNNRPGWNVIEEDIVEVAKNGIYNYLKSPITEVDLLSGGFPCQAFSYAGKKRGLEDTRGTMFYYYAKILEQLKPKMFLAENVKGLVNHDGGKTLNTILSAFAEIGYDVKWKVLSALDYDVAQKRERIVIVGIRKDLTEKCQATYKFPKPYGYELTLRDILKNVPQSEGAQYPEAKRKVLELVPPGGYWRDLPEEVAKEYMGKSYYSSGGRTGMARRLSWDEPSLTLTCSPAQKQTERCHPDETRPFTVREYARIQSFPDSWEFVGSVNNAYKQIGNAVPVNMAKAIGLSIIHALNEINKSRRWDKTKVFN